VPLSQKFPRRQLRLYAREFAGNSANPSRLVS
jgi:hypothetical protein